MIDTLTENTVLKGVLPKNDPKLVLKFIFGGNSIFTLKNSTTGNRFTFKVSCIKGEKGSLTTPYFVRVLTGSDVYTFVGTFFYMNGKWVYRHSNKTKISKNTQSVKVIEYVINHLQSQSLPSIINVWHEGRCGRCGHQLTVPESIGHGFGPECFTLINK